MTKPGWAEAYIGQEQTITTSTKSQEKAANAWQ
jgi:hypothetical protein